MKEDKFGIFVKIKSNEIIVAKKTLLATNMGSIL